ncbi:MAG TPA: multifunctional transcriptional regulator/nicotinamide-nucleotide adenylyltransferase/ribosylnicotinamide kinase NadR, partial [Franconibacter pulveris]|nr:multifunctional transcriptional regulator/nicotinamide-nucleotide adenylyltransferase/ribosylnicotinamide kinase NadR [Franconibacter pulveris]
SSVDRKEYQTMLASMLEANNVDFLHIEEADNDARFLRCVELVKQLMGEQV